jgi:GH24 family phage-related lysozyme (muramidase)
MYLDVLGYVTVGIGNLIDPLSYVVGLPFVHRDDGRPASRSDITAEWLKVKGDASLARLGHRAAERVTSLRLTDGGVAYVVAVKLEQNDRALSKHFPDWESWPACAQLAMHSWAWAGGAGMHFPMLFEALRARDFDAASVHIHINEWSKRPDGTLVHNTGLVPRNIANKILMRNAQRVEAFHLDPDMLDWTHAIGVSDEETQPEIPNPASEPTICVSPIVHVSPSVYLGNEEPDPEPTQS